VLKAALGHVCSNLYAVNAWRQPVEVRALIEERQEWVEANRAPLAPTERRPSWLSQPITNGAVDAALERTARHG
jgi:hypothetical protein